MSALRRRWRELVVLAVVVACYLVARGMVLEDDPVRSLTHPDPERARIFERYQARSAFKDKIFLEYGALTAPEAARLASELRAAGYEEIPLFEPPPLARLLALAPLLPAGEVRRLTSEAAVRARAEEVLAMASLPGGDAFLSAAAEDPLGLAPALVAQLTGAPRDAGATGAAPVHVFRSPRPIDYARVLRLHDLLVALSPRVHFIGADFFAVENYRAVQHDIVLCSSLGLLLTLAVFFAFTTRWVLLALLLAGSVVSYLTGAVAVRLVYGEIYAVVLAYTSTFVGFNNESLVHLAGIDLDRRGRALLGVWSAIGTTFIGFLVLLLGRSVMVRQMALASLGGMVGFLGFLWLYRPTLRAARLPGLSWPQLTLSPKALVAICVAAGAGLALTGFPRLQTHVEAFRFTTPALEAELRHFSRRLDALSLSDVVAIPAAGSPEDAIAPLVAAGAVDARSHPLSRFRDRAAQQETVAELRRTYPAAEGRLTAALEAAGLRLPAPPPLERTVQPIDVWSYLDALGELGPVRWTDGTPGRRWLMVGLRRDAPMPANALPLSPEHHYDALLTASSRELGWLFLAGLALMAIYLAWLQRSAVRVLYVFAPLLLATLAFCAWAHAAHATLSIVHVMAASLVIGLALDYTAVAVSADHARVELTKVLLTGMCTLVSFGVLIFARHPVLRELGAVVSGGCAIGLAFAAFLRLPAGSEGER